MRLACTIAGEVKSFILDTVEKICSAMSWVCTKNLPFSVEEKLLKTNLGLG